MELIKFMLDAMIGLFKLIFYMLKFFITFAFEALKLAASAVCGIVSYFIPVGQESEIGTHRNNHFVPMKKMDGYQYEYFVAQYLKRNGFYLVSVTKASGDFGVDITAYKGKAKYAIQCKYYSSSVGVEAIQQAVAGMAHYGCSKAMVITNAYFTSSAKTLASENGVVLLEGVSP